MTPDFEAVIEADRTSRRSRRCSIIASTAEDFVKAVKEARSRTEHQYFDLDRRRGAVLPCGRHSAAQRRVFARLRRQDREAAECAGDDALDHVRPWHGRHSLAKKMIDWVKEGRRTPDEAATYLTRFCSCGVFNPSRAKRILEEARVSSK